MRVTRIIFYLGVVAIIAAFALFGWLYLPSPRQRISHTFPPDQLPLEAGLSLPEGWTAQLDGPRSIHLGGSGTLRLTVSPGSTALPRDPLTYGSEGPVPNVFSNHSVALEARAEIPAAGASPSGISSQTLTPGQSARFEWRLTPQSEGMLEGRVWLYLRLLPTEGTEFTRRPLSVSPVTIKSDTLFGRITEQVRQIAFICLGIGLVLALPHVLLRSHTRRAGSQAQNSDQQL